MRSLIFLSRSFRILVSIIESFNLKSYLYVKNYWIHHFFLFKQLISRKALIKFLNFKIIFILYYQWNNGQKFWFFKLMRAFVIKYFWNTIICIYNCKLLKYYGINNYMHIELLLLNIWLFTNIIWHFLKFLHLDII